MSIQSPLKDGLYVRPIRPDRRWIRIFVKYYPFVIGGLISAAVLPPLYFADPLLPFLVAGGYWAYLLVRVWFRREAHRASVYARTSTQLVRGLLLISAVTVMLAWVYNRTAYLQNYTDDSLWLLYFPAILVVSQRGSRRALGAVLVVAILCLYFVSPGRGIVLIPLLKPVTLELFIKCIWLILLSLTSYILLRYMSDAIADLNLIINIQNRMREMEGAFLRSRVQLDENGYLEKVVEIIKGDLCFDHVNIFRLDKFSRRLTCMAGACPDGKRLAAEGYTVDMVEQESIIGSVANTGIPYVTNDAAHDTHYLPHPAFPKTRAELVFPIVVRSRLYGVLDIQVHQGDYFLDQDLKAIEILANNIGWVIDNSEQYEHISWVNRIVETIAAPIFTQNHLDDTLQEIANSAQAELGADLVLLYSYDPSDRETLTGPIYSGDPLHPELIHETSIEKDNVVGRMLTGSDEIYLNEDLRQVNLKEHPIFRPSRTHLTTGRPTFIEREKIMANAIVRMMSNEQCVGLLFLNYRKVRTFNAWDRRRYFSFAHLAALAIQKMHSQQHVIRNEMHDLSNLIHDMLVGDTLGLFKILNSIDISPESGVREKARTRIELAKDATTRLHNDIRYINRILKENTSDDLPVELDKLSIFFNQVFKVVTERKWSGDTRMISPRLARELYIVVREALTNAVKHGKATRISILGDVKLQSFHAIITDDGTGFDPTQVKRMNGLLSMRRRIEELGGEFKLNSNPGRGTKITLKVPIQGTDGGD